MYKNLLFFLLLFCYNMLEAQYSPVGSGVPGVNDFVHTMEVDEINDIMYVGGEFTTAGGQFSPFIASWDGVNWGSMGNGFNASVRDIIIFNDTIYACGEFTMSGTDTMNSIAKWNGSSWEKVGEGFNNKALTMCVFNNELYCGGLFTETNGLECKRLAKWNGSQWQEIGGGLSWIQAYSNFNIGVYALEVYQGQLMVGGSFAKADNATMTIDGNVVIWNGFNWTDPGDCDIYNVVKDFILLDQYNVVVAVGAEDSYFVSSARSFDGVNWLNPPYAYPLPHLIVGDLLSNHDLGVNTMAFYDGQYYFGGDYTEVNQYLGSNSWHGPYSEQYMHIFEDGFYYPVANGLNNSVNNMTIFQNELYIGGNFTRTNDNELLNHITRWKSPLKFETSSTDVSCPNSSDGTATIEVTSGNAPYTYLWSNGMTDSTITNVSAGTYSFTITDAAGRQATGVETVYAPAQMTVFVNGSPSSNNNGTALATPSFGTPPYSFLWSNGVTVNNLNNLSVGTYTVTVTDFNDCFVTESIFIDTFIVAPLDTTNNDTTVIDTSTSISEINPLYKVYPNPTKRNIFIEDNHSIKNSTIKLFDLMGQEHSINIEKSSRRLNTIDISHLDNGVYLLFIYDYNLNSMKTIKVVLNK